jgi:trehalose synthase
MTKLLEAFEGVVYPSVLSHIRHLGRLLEGKSVVHVNSTRLGGGVAEILHRLVPLMKELGIDTRWEVITGEDAFFAATKTMHNAVQGSEKGLSREMTEVFEETNRENARRLAPIVSEADFVFVHDPQPVPLCTLCPERKGKWLWRCHIDASRPNRRVWAYLRNWILPYDGSIFSLPEFAQPMPHPEYLVPPSIDPLSDKNCDLEPGEVTRTLEEFGIDPDRPLAVQVSRFDRFKDPLGVIEAYRLCRRSQDLQLVLAGGEATDDPEGSVVLRDVLDAASGDPDIHVLVLPADAHRTINALQRGADVVLQKSTKEGFGLTVSEALWKEKPVIGGDTGGIRLQIIDRFNGFRVRTAEGAALRLRYLLQHRARAERMGENARAYVRENFLITRQLRNVLAILVAQLQGDRERLEVFVP